MRAFVLLLLVAATLNVSSDALSTLNGRVDEEHNAIVVEGMWLVQCMLWRISSVLYFSLVSKSVYAARPVSATNKQNGNEAELFVFLTIFQAALSLWTLTLVTFGEARLRKCSRQSEPF